MAGFGGTEPSRHTVHELLSSEDATAPDHNPLKQLLEEISVAFDRKAFETVITIVDSSAAVQSPTSDGNSQAFAAWALIMKADALQQLGNLDAAVAGCDDIVQRFGTSESPGLRQWVALVTIAKAEMLIEMGRVQDALQTSDDFDSRLRNLDDERKRRLAWHAVRVRTRALLAQPDLPGRHGDVPIIARCVRVG